MKRFNFISLLIVILNTIGVNAFAYDIEVENADGVTIFYRYINHGEELEVAGAYKTATLVIPEEVTYMDITRKVTSIGDKAFKGRSILSSVIIPNSVTKIGEMAFESCSNLCSVDFGKNLEFIGESAFSQCGNLVSLTFPNSIKSIGRYAFGPSYSLNVYISDMESWCKIKFGHLPFGYYTFYHLFLNDKEVKDLVIPNSITTIGDNTFSSCSLTSVTIPNSVTSIGNASFRECSGLNSVSIPNSVISIGSEAFSECVSLTSVSLPSSISYIGSSAFFGCDHLTSINIPNGVTSIEQRTFQKCSSLISASIPNSVTKIGGSAFGGCTSLASIVIPPNVTKIGSHAFGRCISLTTITIPNSVNTIKEGAFRDVDFTSVISLIENPFNLTWTYNNEIFSDNAFANATLYVPVGTIDKYKTTSGWRMFVNIKEGTGDNNGIDNVCLDDFVIQNNSSTLEISGADVGKDVIVYDTTGKIVGSAKASAGTTAVSTSLRSGEIGIVKIGEKAVKVVIQ